MSARQVNAQEAIVSITKKMEAMLLGLQSQYDKSIEILTGAATVIKNEVAVELKKQTSILTRIESKLSKMSGQSSGGKVSDGGLGGMVGSIGNALMTIVKVLIVAGILGSLILRGARFLSEAITTLINVAKTISIRDAVVSVSIFKILGESKLKELLEVLSPKGIFGLFSGNAGMVKKAKAIKDSIVILFSAADEIDIGKALKSALIYALLGYGVTNIVSTVKNAFFFAPIIKIGAKAVKTMVSTLLSSITSISAGAGDLLKASIFLVTLTFVLGSLITFTVIAALLSPLILIGALTIRFMISQISAISGTLEKVKTENFDKLNLIAAIIGILASAIVVVVASQGMSNPEESLIKLGIFIVMAFTLTAMTIGIAMLMKKFELKPLDVLSGALSSLIQSVSLLIASKALGNMGESFTKVGIFVALSLALTLNLILIAKFIKKDNLSIGVAIKLLIFTGAILLSVMLINAYMGSVGPSSIGSILMFSLISLLIAGTAYLIGKMIGNNLGQILKASLALVVMSISLIIVGLTVKAFSNTVSVMDVLFTMLAVGGLALAFYIIGKFFTDILKGALAVAAIGLGISFLALGLFFYKSVGMTWEETAMLGVTIAGLGIVMGIAGLAAVEIALGAAAMALAGLAVVVISLGLGAFKLTGFKLEDALALGAAIGAIGITMGVAGLASPFIIAGSAAMAIAGVALLPLVLGLATFKAIGWQKGTDDENLKSALGSVISGFLGGDMPGGILASIKFAAQAAARSVLLFVAIPPMILAGVALLSISLGLAAFKKSGFTSADSVNMEAAIGGIVGAFSLITDKERQKKMGINVDWMDLMIGIMSLSQAGNTLSSLAKGIQAFANLSVIEYEVVGAGTKNAKIVPKGITKLSKSDFEAAAYGMAQVISAIAEPFALVGKLDKGTPSGNPFYDAIFGGGFVSAGISALSRSGDTLVNLAKGVQAFANLEITEYEVIGAGTKDAKIVPKSITKMSPTDFAAAGANIAKVISVVAEAFAKVGKDEAASEGIFSGGFLSKGVDALSNIGENLQGITESVIKVATGTFTPMTAVQDGKGTKLVPGTPIKISKAMLEEAARTINSVIMVLGRGMMDFGTFVDENEDSIDEAIEYIPTMSEALMKMVEVNEKFSKITDADKGVQAFTSFNQAVMDAYDPAKQKNLPQTAGYMMLFVKGIERLAAPADQLGKVASNVERIEAAMKNIKTHVNGFDMERLTKTDSLFKSMAMLSKNPEAMAAKINETLKVAFEEFGKALTEAIKESGGGGGGGDNAPVGDAPKADAPKGDAPKGTDPKAKAGPPPLTAEAIGAAMTKALNAASITVKPATSAVFKTTT